MISPLVQVSDYLGNVSIMQYDLLGRKSAISDHNMGEWAYQYDPAGNLTAQQDGRSDRAPRLQA